MGVVVPNFASSTEDRASGAQVIDGSLRFDGSSFLTRTVSSSSSSLTTGTVSFWFKRSTNIDSGSNQGNLVGTNDTYNPIQIFIDSLYLGQGSEGSAHFSTAAKFRDPNAWYHSVFVFDTTLSTAADRLQIYVNGVRYSDAGQFNTNAGLNDPVEIFNSTNQTYQIGARDNALAHYFGGYMSQFYFIDGQALDASYFGYTDPLTNTWRPKKYTGTYGTNGFYLPMDGNSLIGEDKSGNGNDFTPVNFGGSNTIEKATGAFPILNTVNGGRVATAGVRTDAYASNLVLALPLVGNSNDVHHLIKGSGSAKTITVNGNAAASSVQSNFYGGSFIFDGTGDSLSLSSTSDFGFGTGDFTIECFVYYKGSFPTFEYIYDMRIDSSTGSELRGALYPTSNGGQLEYYVNGATVLSAGKFYKDRWYHVALVRNSSTTSLYLNGVDIGSFSDSNNYADAPLVIGQRQGITAQSWDGYIQDFRIYKGVAKYTSNFIPASTNPDILPDTPSGVAGGSALTKITDGAVSFDGNGDYLSLADSDDWNFGSGDWTIEFYGNTKATTNGELTTVVTQSLYGASSDTSFYVGMGSYVSCWLSSGTNYQVQLNTSGVVVNDGNWHHIACVRNGTNIIIFVDGKNVANTTVSAEYTLGNSTQLLGIGSQNNNYFFPGFISNLRIIKGTALYTSDFTPPTRALTAVANTKLLCCQSNTSATAAAIIPADTNGTGYTGNTSAITVTSANLDSGSDTNTVDGNTSTSANIRNAGSFVQLVFPQQQNGTLQVNVANGNDSSDDNIRVFIDGVEGTSFDVSSQQWYTIHTGNFTTVKLEQQGSTTGSIFGFRIGTDGDTIINASTSDITANGNAAATNFNPFTTDINAVRGQESGYCTLNRLHANNVVVNGYSTLSNGNLTASAASNGNGETSGTIGVSSGKWYFELINESGGNNTDGVGIADLSSGIEAICRDNGVFRYNGSQSSYGSSWQTIGDVIGVKVDLDNSTIGFYKNGVYQGDAKTDLPAVTYHPFVYNRAGAPAASTLTLNFGQNPFKFPPPEGFQPLNAANVRPSTVIARPDQYVGVTTYVGDQSSRVINCGFKPDFVWIKERTGAYHHAIYDSVRGPLKSLSSSRVDIAEQTETEGLNSFVTNGFSFAGGGPGFYYVNRTGGDYVAWTWKAGGNSNTFNVDGVGYATASDAGITDGTIALTGASVNTVAGFSILTFTGQSNAGSIAHGLSKKPSFIIGKNRDRTTDWKVYLPNTGQYGDLSTNAAQSSVSNGYTGATSSLINLQGSGYGLNYATDNQCVIYCWTEIEGFSKFGQWNNNNANDGAFIELGFRPAMILLKNTDNVEDWYIIDSARHPYNKEAPSASAADAVPSLNPNQAHSESTSQGGHPNTTVDILSNGFKIRTTNPGSGEISFGTRNYIYAAWAEAPTVNLYGAQSNAR